MTSGQALTLKRGGTPFLKEVPCRQLHFGQVVPITGPARVPLLTRRCASPSTARFSQWISPVSGNGSSGAAPHNHGARPSGQPSHHRLGPVSWAKPFSLPDQVLLKRECDWNRRTYFDSSTCSKSSSTGVARPKIETETLTFALSKSSSSTCPMKLAKGPSSTLTESPIS